MCEEIIMNNPKVSIIITYHNAQDTIKDCINSVLKQTFKDFELICINNASTDESEKIVIDLEYSISPSDYVMHKFSKYAKITYLGFLSVNENILFNLFKSFF